ncbi:hypothetical protein [Phaeobacter piscinae]|uniref:hypothetical protein n=1 Tax=Phaeobacter piscinae TaxID=1580596 RepID=UPI000598DF7C|nr:hypothetical protein [Phaeobacter piscinae]UTS82744.1 hypothetical protein OL67_003854 [Phaeobacter piscinae]
MKPPLFFFALALSLGSPANAITSEEVMERLGANFSDCDRMIAAVELLAVLARVPQVGAETIGPDEKRTVAEGIVAVREQCPVEWHQRDVFSRPQASFYSGVFD